MRQLKKSKKVYEPSDRAMTIVVAIALAIVMLVVAMITVVAILVYQTIR